MLQENSLVNRSNLEYVGYYYDGSSYPDVVVSNNIVYLDEGSKGIEILNVANVKSITRIGSLKPIHGYTTTSVFLENHYLYITTSIYGLYVYNCSNPYALTLLGKFYNNDGYGSIVLAINGTIV